MGFHGKNERYAFAFRVWLLQLLFVDVRMEMVGVWVALID